MSSVTNLILHAGCGYAADDACTMTQTLLRTVNALPALQGQQFTIINGGEVGGAKALECCLFIGAFNHIVLEDLLHELRTMAFDWRMKDEIQLIYKRQHDDRFHIVTLFEAEAEESDEDLLT